MKVEFEGEEHQKMPSEKSRYLKNRTRPSVDFWDLKNLLVEESPERLSELLLIAGERFTPLSKVLYIVCGAKQFEQFADYKLLEKNFLFAVTLDDVVSYDKAGAYSIIAYELVDFFKKMKQDHKLDEKLSAVLKNVILALESSAELLMDDGNSWSDAAEELRVLL